MRTDVARRIEGKKPKRLYVDVLCPGRKTLFMQDDVILNFLLPAAAVKVEVDENLSVLELGELGAEGSESRVERVLRLGSSRVDRRNDMAVEVGIIGIPFRCNPGHPGPGEIADDEMDQTWSKKCGPRRYPLK